MPPVISTQQRLRELFERLDVGDGAAPPPTPHTYTIGTCNPALAELKRRRGQLNSRQDNLVDNLDAFYSDVQESKTNGGLGFALIDRSMTTIPSDQRATLLRRASFLLNTEAMRTLEEVIEPVFDNPSRHTYSLEKLAANAILNSVKKHTEHVIGAALQDARNGDRVCPMMLQSDRFDMFLATNSFHVNNILRACRLAQPARDHALQPALESFAESYFAYALNHPGAIKEHPQNVEIRLNSSAQSQAPVDRNGNLTARISIDSAGAEQFCRALRVNPDPEAQGYDVFRTRLLSGFEAKPLEKKLAGFYMQLLFQELAEMEEVIGVRSADRPEHGPAAQRAARRTLEEWEYKGSLGFGDAIQRDGEPVSQREYVTLLATGAGKLNAQFAAASGTPLIAMPEVRAWAQSPAASFDLRALREPSARLALQVPPLTGRALLDMPEFRE